MRWLDSPHRRLFFAATLLGIVLLVAGCAHRRAIKTGDEYANEGNWKRAYEFYRDAKEARPKSDEAREKVRRAREKAVANALARADRSLGERAYRKTVSEIEYVRELEPDNERASKLYRKTDRTLSMKVRVAIENGRAGRAYELRRTHAELFPDREENRPPRTRIRGVVYTRADGLAEEGEYGRAIEALGTISEHESGRVAGVSQRENTYRQRWADSLEKKAREWSGTHDGVAVVYRARAYRVAGREDDLEAFRKLASELQAKGRLSMAVRFRGAGSRDLRQPLVRKLSAVEGIETTSDRGDVTLSAEVSQPRCRETEVRTFTESKRYLAGTEEVRNPTWYRYRDRLEEARDRADRLKHRMHRAKHEWRDEKEDARRCDHDRLRGERRRLERIEESLRAHDDDLQEVERHLREARREVRRLENMESCDENRLQSAREDVRSLRETLRKERQKHREGRRELREKREEVRRLERRHRELHEEAEEARAEYHERAEDYEHAVDEVRALASKLDRTPRTKTREIWKTFRYEASEWRRSCSRRVSVRMTTPGGDETSFEIAPTESVTDEAHPAHSRYGVQRNPREYSKSSGQLVASVDSSLVDGLAERSKSTLAGVVQNRADRFLRATRRNPHAATDTLLAIALATGTHLTSRQMEAISEHLDEHYGAHLPEVRRLYTRN